MAIRVEDVLACKSESDVARLVGVRRVDIGQPMLVWLATYAAPLVLLYVMIRWVIPSLGLKVSSLPIQYAAVIAIVTVLGCLAALLGGIWWWVGVWHSRIVPWLKRPRTPQEEAAQRAYELWDATQRVARNEVRVASLVANWK